MLQRSDRNGVRLAFVDREIPGLNADLISTDHERGGYLEAQHLLKMDRKNLVCVATHLPEHRSTSVRERLQGIDRALREAGLGPATVLGTDLPDFAVHEHYGYDVMREYLKRAAGRFDSVCAAYDGLAYGVIRALVEAGFRVPKDVAVVGFDDQDPSAYFQPPLTTLRQPMREIGMEAARLLFRRLSEPNMAVTRQRIVLEPTLIVRESSSVPKTKWTESGSGFFTQDRALSLIHRATQTNRSRFRLSSDLAPARAGHTRSIIR